MSGQERRGDLPHSVIIEGRERINLSGVTDVVSFDENIIETVTTRGYLSIQGNDLHIDSMSVNTGDLIVTGELTSLVYSTDDRGREGFFSRIFR